MEIKDLSWNESITKRFNNPLLPRSINPNIEYLKKPSKKIYRKSVF